MQPLFLASSQASAKPASTPVMAVFPEYSGVAVTGTASCHVEEAGS